MRVELAQIRVSQNISQSKLAKLAGITQAYLSEIESGQKTPSPFVAGKISEELKIPEEKRYRIFYTNMKKGS